MTERRNTLYSVLFYICLLVTFLIILISALSFISMALRIAFLIVSLFVFIMGCSYFNLSREDNKEGGG